MPTFSRIQGNEEMLPSCECLNCISLSQMQVYCRDVGDPTRRRGLQDLGLGGCAYAGHIDTCEQVLPGDSLHKLACTWYGLTKRGWQCLWLHEISCKPRLPIDALSEHQSQLDRSWAHSSRWLHRGHALIALDLDFKSPSLSMLCAASVHLRVHETIKVWHNQAGNPFPPAKYTCNTQNTDFIDCQCFWLSVANHDMSEPYPTTQKKNRQMLVSCLFLLWAGVVDIIALRNLRVLKLWDQTWRPSRIYSLTFEMSQQLSVLQALEHLVSLCVPTRETASSSFL